jgi:hypothetical protein
VRTAAFCFITERASIEPTQHWIRKAGERLRGVCRANRAVALMAPEESVEIGDNESLNRWHPWTTVLYSGLCRVDSCPMDTQCRCLYCCTVICTVQKFEDRGPIDVARGGLETALTCDGLASPKGACSLRQPWSQDFNRGKSILLIS